MANTKIFLRRREAGAYLKEKYGFCSARSLAKLACVGGGPEIIYFGTIPTYTAEGLDAWALSKMHQPVRRASERDATNEVEAAQP